MAKANEAQASKPKSFQFEVRSIDVVLKGREGSPLVVHAFTEKAKAEIRAKQQKKAKAAKAERNPHEEFLAARYVNNQGQECVSITVIKKAIINAATAFDDVTKVGLRQAVFAYPTRDPGASLLPILTPDGSDARGRMLESAVTIGINTRGLVYRPCYDEWMLEVSIQYSPRIVSEEQLLALIDHAGWGIGICEGRPERSSALGWGRFERVESAGSVLMTG